MGQHVLRQVPVRPPRRPGGRRVALDTSSSGAPRVGSTRTRSSSSPRTQGATEDTLAALRFARSRGARTVALVNRAESPIGDGADVTIAYGSPGLYCLPMAAVTACSRASGRPPDGSREAAEHRRAPARPAGPRRPRLPRRPRPRPRPRPDVRPVRPRLLRRRRPLYGLAYKFGLTVFMENMRIHSSVIETAEFRHGPAEMLDRRAPDMAVLVGTDESRAMSERVLRLAGERGARTLVFDAADHDGLTRCSRRSSSRSTCSGSWSTRRSCAASTTSTSGPSWATRCSRRGARRGRDRAGDHRRQLRRSLPAPDRPRHRRRERPERRRRARRRRAANRLRGSHRRRRRRQAHPRRGRRDGDRHAPRRRWRRATRA